MYTYTHIHTIVLILHHKGQKVKTTKSLVRPQPLEEIG